MTLSPKMAALREVTLLQAQFNPTADELAVRRIAELEDMVQWLGNNLEDIANGSISLYKARDHALQALRDGRAIYQPKVGL